MENQQIPSIDSWDYWVSHHPKTFEYWTIKLNTEVRSNELQVKFKSNQIKSNSNQISN